MPYILPGSISSKSTGVFIAGDMRYWYILHTSCTARFFLWVKINGDNQHNPITSAPVHVHQHFSAHRHLVAGWITPADDDDDKSAWMSLSSCVSCVNHVLT